MSRLALLLSGLVASTALASVAGALRAADDAAPDGRIFEMRTYIANDGKLADLHKRFREHTNRLFTKHGMTLIGYWTPVAGPEKENTLVYILAYPNREAREKSWAAFQADPDWQAARTASEVNGKLVKKVVQQFLTPTDYSPLK